MKDVRWPVAELSPGEARARFPQIDFDGVRTVALHDNHGKGYAMAVGVANASWDNLFFCDGDMYNVTEEHIRALAAWDPSRAGDLRLERKRVRTLLAEKAAAIALAPPRPPVTLRT